MNININLFHGIILNSGTCYEFDVNARTDSQKTPLVTFSQYLRYYQKKVPGPGGELKDGVASIGHSLTWGRKDDAFVIGAPNFNLGNPHGTKKTDSGTFKDQRFGGFGNILRFGIVSERGAPKIALGKRVLMNPSKGREKNAFRQNLKKEIKDAEQGTPALYLGWAVITGKMMNFYMIFISYNEIRIF